jgi:sulfonate transport system substrate-binding protein
MKVSRRTSLGLIGGAVALPVFNTGHSSAATIVRFSYQRSSTLLTLLKTNDRLSSRFAEKGFATSWNLFDNVINAMNSGAVDFHADVADAVPVFTQSAGAQLTFYAKEDASPSSEAIIVRADSPISSLQDLKGKTVAVHRGSGCHFILAAALKRVGLSFHDIKPAYLTPSDASAAFERRSIDAWVIWDPFLAITENKYPTRTLCDASGLSSYYRYYAVGNAFAEAHPDLVKIVFDALVDTGVWVKKNPEEAARVLSPIWGGIAPSVIEIVNKRRSYAVKPVTKAGLWEQQAIADTFLEAGLIPKKLDAADLRIWSPHEGKS